MSAGQLFNWVIWFALYAELVALVVVVWIMAIRTLR